MSDTSAKFTKQSLEAQVVRFGPYVVIGAIVAIWPLFMPDHLQSLMTRILIFGIFAMSLNLLMGYTGLFSFGHAAFFAVGAYTTGILIIRCSIESFWIVAPAGVFMAALVAAAFGIIALRTSGIFFLLVTFALGQLVFTVAWKWRSVTGGSDALLGIPRPDLGLPWLTWNDISLYYFILFFFAISVLLLYWIANSAFGHALQGIRESERRMRSLGYNTWLFKYFAFVIAGLFAGVAGVLFAYYNGLVSPAHADVTTSGLVMLMVIIGGTGVIFGPIIGATVILLLGYFASLVTPERWPLILGVVFIVAIMYLRQGFGVYLLELLMRLKDRYGSAKG